MSTYQIIEQFLPALLKGITQTLRLASIVWIVGLILGSILGVAGAWWPKAVGVPSRSISFFLAAIPTLVLLLWMHYPAQAMLGVVIDPFLTAAFTLTVVNVFAVAEMVRNVVQKFPRQYITAAEVCGVPRRQIVLKIQLPIMLREMTPSLLSQQVGMLQATIFASMISVQEIYRVTQQINAKVYRPVETYSALAVFFIAICMPLNGLVVYLSNRSQWTLSQR
jgi:polar amino acid transport system permease protein